MNTHDLTIKKEVLKEIGAGVLAKIGRLEDKYGESAVIEAFALKINDKQRRIAVMSEREIDEFEVICNFMKEIYCELEV